MNLTGVRQGCTKQGLQLWRIIRVKVTVGLGQLRHNSAHS